jgi:hypothetical protein
MKATTERKYFSDTSKKKNIVKDGRGSLLVYYTDVESEWKRRGLP